MEYNNQSNSSPKSNIKHTLFLVFSTLIILGLWFANFLFDYFFQFKTLDPHATSGQFGDKFGAVNALFSGLAFLGIIYTLYIQREDMKLTRKEMAEQNTTMIIQRFENTFFNILESNRNNIMDLNIRQERRIVKNGEESFKTIEHKGKDFFRYILSLRFKNFQDLSDKECFYRLQNYNYSNIITYFKSQYQIIKFIDNYDLRSKNQDEVKYLYTSIVRNQLSEAETVMLFLNCLYVDSAKEKFKPLVEKYGLLKNLNFNLIKDKESIKEFDNRAYFLSKNAINNIVTGLDH